MAEQDATTSIRQYASVILRKENPYMKTQTLDSMLDELTAGLRRRIQQQVQESEATKSRANFFMLPAEIRNTIYELVLVGPNPLEAGPPKKGQAFYIWKPSYGTCGSVYTPILQSCRQVRHEALPIFWGLNTFEVELRCRHPSQLDELDLRKLCLWKGAIGDTQFAMIKNVNIKLYLQDCENQITVNNPWQKDQLTQYATFICRAAGASPEELRSDLRVQEWNVDIILKILKLAKLGMDEANFKIQISTECSNWPW
ncbi:hypothetical protein DOTSEDRAFT_26271 [Dothistroma septosporum NZE10]|uniref:Uncharacterized protein n=1 Tax=Dothistroma septosporum (strain NZE10 / CBS 128990) TaxID=675120 RepID=N1PK05_DOTSN|nr:hypothetical protein DOTSEDRAFT_26271 [Dothistroma septosporum NZE10]